MVPIRVDGPAVEPVSLAAMRAYLRLDDGAEDDLVQALIAAARLAVEGVARVVLIESRWRILLDAWPAAREIRLPVGPLIAVDRITVAGRDGGAFVLGAASYRVVGAPETARILIETGVPAPAREGDGIAIELRAGYGPSAESVPAPLVQAVRLLAGRWFEHRGDGEPGAGLPADVLALVAPYRRARL